MPAPETALFVTGLVDEFYPEVGEAALSLLERTGARVAFPEAQPCCGQPLFNMGYRNEARDIARRLITIFEAYTLITGPSPYGRHRARSHGRSARPRRALRRPHRLRE